MNYLNNRYGFLLTASAWVVTSKIHIDFKLGRVGGIAAGALVDFLMTAFHESVHEVVVERLERKDKRKIAALIATSIDSLSTLAFCKVIFENPHNTFAVAACLTRAGLACWDMFKENCDQCSVYNPYINKIALRCIKGLSLAAFVSAAAFKSINPTIHYEDFGNFSHQ